MTFALSSGNEEESNPWSNSCFGFFCKEYCHCAKSPVLPLQSSSLSFKHVPSSSWLPHTVGFQNKTQFPRQSGDATPESYTAPVAWLFQFVVLLTQSRNQELHLSSILSFIIVIVFYKCSMITDTVILTNCFSCRHAGSAKHRRAAKEATKRKSSTLPHIACCCGFFFSTNIK